MWCRELKNINKWFPLCENVESFNNIITNILYSMINHVNNRLHDLLSPNTPQVRNLSTPQVGNLSTPQVGILSTPQVGNLSSSTPWVGNICPNTPQMATSAPALHKLTFEPMCFVLNLSTAPMSIWCFPTRKDKIFYNPQECSCRT